MSHTEYRLPAEWERQSATVLAWPHEETDWANCLDEIRHEYLHLIDAILPRQQVILLTHPGDTSARKVLGRRARLHMVDIPFNDTWCRDYGPITLVGPESRLALDFNFDGWGGKHPAALDNRVNTQLARHHLFSRLDFRQYLFELEGGAIDSDGRGTLLVNWHCMHARHSHLTRGEIEHELHQLLNIDHVIGIDIEPMSGDDTDGHIDTLTRFISPDILVFQLQASEKRNQQLRDQLEGLRSADGQAFELYALPHAEDINADLPASYANFLFVNGACLVPAFGSDHDEVARGILADLLPDFDVRSVPAGIMIRQSGGPHCASMHIPA
ncbi:agmatine deiminase family protein [Wenzhouxiangella sp. AB-CW3]|uniref:agmatine deiminase family protein n=1 Tax=Wenzhouxiangella sp. AB-CW3 TaxID=2771012 RepID=UPI00168B9718|nr:agmatine deiminase family protein [Wenzhouxiangella sp. AB-CW3]QOC21253.1 agmatine deiminase family protein [Wenzhouxiangella sp. AB-CW3]